MDTYLHPPHMEMRNMDVKSLSEGLITAYGKVAFETLDTYFNIHEKRVLSRLNSKDRAVTQSITALRGSIDRYNDANDLFIAESVIEMDKLYSGLEERQKKHPSLGMQDCLVLELLHYFKNDFFTWVTKPKCTNCGKCEDNIVMKGAVPPPNPNPDEITRVEVYTCNDCGINVAFPRINNPVRLLYTRKGRCGEWVNCFMLVLKAVLGEDSKTRYVWNNEDHVWCEYYSHHLKRWIHLDPCEAAFDQPNLYTDNWGKKMSWVIGINDSYVMDLSSKYINNPEKKIDQSTVVTHVSLVNDFIKLSAFQQMKNYVGQLKSPEDYRKFYYDCLVLFRQERNPHRTELLPSIASLNIRGRQTGGAEWTKARGEDGV